MACIPRFRSVSWLTAAITALCFNIAITVPMIYINNEDSRVQFVIPSMCASVVLYAFIMYIFVARDLSVGKRMLIHHSAIHDLEVRERDEAEVRADDDEKRQHLQAKYAFEMPPPSDDHHNHHNDGCAAHPHPTHYQFPQRSHAVLTNIDENVRIEEIGVDIFAKGTPITDERIMILSPTSGMDGIGPLHRGNSDPNLRSGVSSPVMASPTVARRKSRAVDPNEPVMQIFPQGVNPKGVNFAARTSLAPPRASGDAADDGAATTVTHATDEVVSVSQVSAITATTTDTSTKGGKVRRQRQHSGGSGGDGEHEPFASESVRAAKATAGPPLEQHDSVGGEGGGQGWDKTYERPFFPAENVRGGNSRSAANKGRSKAAASGGTPVINTPRRQSASSPYASTTDPFMTTSQRSWNNSVTSPVVTARRTVSFKAQSPMQPASAAASNAATPSGANATTANEQPLSYSPQTGGGDAWKRRDSVERPAADEQHAASGTQNGSNGVYPPSEHSVRTPGQSSLPGILRRGNTQPLGNTPSRHTADSNKDEESTAVVPIGDTASQGNGGGGRPRGNSQGGISAMSTTTSKGSSDEDDFGEITGDEYDTYLTSNYMLSREMNELFFGLAMVWKENRTMKRYLMAVELQLALLNDEREALRVREEIKTAAAGAKGEGVPSVFLPADADTHPSKAKPARRSSLPRNLLPTTPVADSEKASVLTSDDEDDDNDDDGNDNVKSVKSAQSYKSIEFKSFKSSDEE